MYVLVQDGCQKHRTYGWKAEHNRHDDAAAHKGWQQVSDRAYQGIDGDPHGVLHDELQGVHTLGSGGDHVGLAQLIQQVVSHDTDQAGRSRGAENDRRYPQVLNEIVNLCQAPGSGVVIGREKAADALVEVREGNVHQHQA